MQATGQPNGPSLPLLDVRSPGEFSQGHIPGAVNIPLFNDQQRAEVGTLYKQEGKDKAVLYGLAAVGPGLEAFAQRLLAACGPAKEVAMYCSRGGMRSASVAWLMNMSGITVQLLDGGYKSFRRHVLEFFESKPLSSRLQVLGGGTGSGKTEVLLLMAELGAQVLDLEGMARHRGSAFGSLEGKAQPSSEHFENLLALALMQCSPELPVWVEDECENLGSVNIPRTFFQSLRSAAFMVIEVSREVRLKRVLRDYGTMDAERMALGIDRIRKRLGGLEHKKAHLALAEGNLEALAGILLDYYDRAYEKQMKTRIPLATICTDDPEEAAARLCGG